jgi:hypothetical protein
MTNHSALPWHVGDLAVNLCDANGGDVLSVEGICTTVEVDEANAALIVKAVNNHEELVSCLRGLAGGLAMANGADAYSAQSLIKSMQSLVEHRLAALEAQ